MSTPNTSADPTHDRPLRRALAGLQWLCGAGLAAMLGAAAWKQALDGWVAQFALTFLCVLLGSWLMRVQLGARARYAGGNLSKLLAVGVAVVVVSQVCFLLLVWTVWKTDSLIWRFWWVSMVLSVLLTHLLLLRPTAPARWGMLETAASFSAIWAAAMILCLALRPNPLSDIPSWYLWTGLVPVAATVATSLLLWVRFVLRRTELRTISRKAAVAGVLLSHLLVAVAAFYLGRATAPTRQGPTGPAGATGPTGLLHTAGDSIRAQVGRDVYGLQAGVAEWLGDTRIVNRPPFITEAQALAVERRLQPGDILLERRNWYLSNPFLPGFWPHSAIYIGRPQDLQALGIADHPAVKKHLADLARPAKDGHAKTVIEAVSEGVIFNSLPHSIHADYVAVLRPRLTKEQIGQVLITAFSHHGKPYDFDFDFTTTDKLVCTQLVYLAYKGLVDFPLQRVAGRTTLPALEIARKYVANRGQPDRRLDFVLFLDGDVATGKARDASEQDFCESLTRPSALVEK